MKTDEGGNKSDDNYNKNKSPGEKYKQQDQTPKVDESTPPGSGPPLQNMRPVISVSPAVVVTTFVGAVVIIANLLKFVPPI